MVQDNMSVWLCCEALSNFMSPGFVMPFSITWLIDLFYKVFMKKVI